MRLQGQVGGPGPTGRGEGYRGPIKGTRSAGPMGGQGGMVH